MDRRESTKQSQLLECLEKGMTMIHLDARRPGVLVPEKFKGDHQLMLNLSYRFDPPDLAVSDWGVRQTLSFGGSRFTVAIPWSAVYAVASMVTREVFMFPEDMPEEVVGAATEKAQLPPTQAETDAPKTRAVLREVERPGDDTEPPPDPPTAPKRGHLRVVK
jgi:stringent starvation protein B